MAAAAEPDAVTLVEITMHAATSASGGAYAGGLCLRSVFECPGERANSERRRHGEDGGRHDGDACIA